MMLVTLPEFDRAAQEALRQVFGNAQDTAEARLLRAYAMEVLKRMRIHLYME